MKTILKRKYGHTDIYTIILISIFIFFTFFKLYNSLTAGLMYDEPETLFNARQIYQGKLPFVDYFEHHPIISYLLLVPFSDISVWKFQRVLMAVLSIISSIILYIFLSDIFGRKIAILCSISFLVSPLLNRMAIMIIPDSFMIFFFIVGLYFYGRLLKNDFNSNIDIFLLGLFWSLSILSKISSIIPIVIFTLFSIVKFQNRTNKIFSVLGYMTLGYIVPIGITFVVYQFNFMYINSMIEGILSNVHVRQYYSQPISERIIILTTQIISMHVYLWIAGVIGAIYFVKSFFDDRRELKDKLRDKKAIVTLSSFVSLLLLLYYNLEMTVAGWAQYYMINVVILSIIIAGFYILIQRYWRNIYTNKNVYKNKVSISIISIALIFFGFFQPFMMSTYPYQPNNHQEEQLLSEWLSNGDNINRNKAVFENWVYFNYLANLRSDYKIPVFSDATFYYLTSIDNSFTDDVLLRRNVYENLNYDTVIFHGPMFDDLFVWIDVQFDKDDWYLEKVYTIPMIDYNDQILFWYPGFNIETFDFQIDIWKRKNGDVSSMMFSHDSGFYTENENYVEIDRINENINISENGGEIEYERDWNSS